MFGVSSVSFLHLTVQNHYNDDGMGLKKARHKETYTPKGYSASKILRSFSSSYEGCFKTDKTAFKQIQLN